MHNLILIDDFNSSKLACINSLDTVFGILNILVVEDLILLCSFYNRSNFESYVQLKFPNLVLSKNLTDTTNKTGRYLKGESGIQLNLAIKGTDFQIQVWKELLKIPYGKTNSYKEISEKIENPKAIRAVGAAIGANEHALLIPCHRVIYSNNTSGHFKWGPELKQKLLNMENPNTFVQKELF